MTVKIYFVWPNGDDDTLIFECDSLEEGQEIAKREVESRNATPTGSEILDPNKSMRY